MREISLDETPNDFPVFTVLNYGDTKSGKTTFASTWPRALILADAVERGYESVKTADRATWFEPERKPIIWALESLADLVELAQPGGRIDQLIASGDVRTIVMDALSYFVELMLNTIIQLQAGKDDNRAAYGTLGKQLRNVRTLIQQKPVSVIWNCITKHPGDDDKRGRPLIPGAQGEAWPGACDFVFRSQCTRQRVIVDVDDGDGKIRKVPEVQESFFINTRQNGAYIAGHRLGVKADQLPDPFVGSYRDFVTCLGYDPEALVKLLKQPPKHHAQIAKIAPAVSKIPPAVAKVPPITSAPKVVTVPPQANNKQR